MTYIRYTMHSPDEAAVYAKMNPPPPLVSIKPSLFPSIEQNDAILQGYKISNYFSYWNQGRQYKKCTARTSDMCICRSSRQVHIQKEPMSHHVTNFRMADSSRKHNQHQHHGHPVPNVQRTYGKGRRRPRTSFSPEQLQILYHHLCHVSCLPTPFQYRQLVSKTLLEYNVVKVN